MTWVPGSCTLPTAEQPLRVAEFDELFAAALQRHDRRDPTWLRLHLAGGEDVGRAVRDLVERETRCCSFFAFAVTATGSGWVVDVRVPEQQATVLDGLERAARAGLPG